MSDFVCDRGCWTQCAACAGTMRSKAGGHCCCDCGDVVVKGSTRCMSCRGAFDRARNAARKDKAHAQRDAA
jgi:hypothetical protein